MCPSTEAAGTQPQFAAGVLRDLLHRIEMENAKGSEPFLISHAWTDGPMIYLVYKAPPSDISWGLARDTRDSIIDPGPWQSMDDPGLYYYLCDLQERRMSASFRHPGDPETILWSGFPREGLPGCPAEIPDEYRYLPSPATPSVEHQDEAHPVFNEPRLYADPP
jgi:hypothetical protein